MHTFSVNSGFLYILAVCVIAFVLAQSVYFLVKAWRRARAVGMSEVVLRRAVVSSAVFSIAPAVSIFLGVITLSKFLGLPLPWLRLSVVGALTYEMPAATAAAGAAGASLTARITDPQIYGTIAWVMTLGIIPGLVIIPIFLKRIQGGVGRIGANDKKWSEIFMNALFIGMVSAFLGLVFADIRELPRGLIPIFVTIVSAAVMIAAGTLIKKRKVAWLENYALPISMLAAMAAAIPITQLLA
jgi:hypothetical protein